MRFSSEPGELAEHAKGYITGEFFDQQGNLIANMSQQTLYRLK